MHQTGRHDKSITGLWGLNKNGHPTWSDRKDIQRGTENRLSIGNQDTVCAKHYQSKISSDGTHIPKPSLDNKDECPPLYYAMVLVRFFIVIWRLFVTFPNQDILLHSQWHQRSILQDLVFTRNGDFFFIIPVGQVFGARSAPSFFSLESDIRTNFATTGSSWWRTIRHTSKQKKSNCHHRRCQGNWLWP